MNEDLIVKTAGMLLKANYAIALTGAGISTESGIPDFRGPSGIWTKNPQAEKMAYKKYSQFLANPIQYWTDALETESLLGDLKAVKPNAGHYALARLEALGYLRCVITQNIDNLHVLAGTKNVIAYHGNVFKVRCINCNSRYSRDEIDLERLRQENRLPPLCRNCGGILKSDIVHFEEPIPEDVINQSIDQALKCDFMLICGTSAVVYPFAELPRIARFGERLFDTQFWISERVYRKTSTIKIIEINIESTVLTDEGISDYIIIGKTGEILPKIVDFIEKEIKGKSS